MKPSYSDLATDICVLRYIGDILGWVLVQFSDDLKDWFYQLKLHVSEYWKSTFAFQHKGGEIKWYQETVMGMGCTHTSNIAQRYSNTILVL